MTETTAPTLPELLSATVALPPEQPVTGEPYCGNCGTWYDPAAGHDHNHTVELQPASSPTAPVYLAYVAARDTRTEAWQALQDAIGALDGIGPARTAYEAAAAAADTARGAYVQALKDQIEAEQ